jgi:pimeloyl-ACP methyl ester carboxylesterase
MRLLAAWLACTPNGDLKVKDDTAAAATSATTPSPTDPTTDPDPGTTPGTTPSDTGGGDPTTADTGRPPDPVVAPDYRAPGPRGVQEVNGSFEASCRMSYRSFLPDGAAPRGLVVLAHGFARDRTRVYGWARHLASWGWAVVTPDLCAAGLINVDHEANGRDLASLGDALGGGGPLFFVGHSAGGLAAFLASANNPSATGHLGLDLTDAFDLGRDAAPGVSAPAYGILGEPELCNSSGNAEGVYGRATRPFTVRLNGADHCDFENPSDLLCELACADGSVSTDVAHAVISALAVAFVEWTSNAEPSAAQWWTPGEGWFDGLVDGGLISPL